MVETVLPPLLQVLFEKLASPIIAGFGYHFGIKKKIENLRHTLRTIQAVLEDAEERQVNDKAVRIWMARLKDVVYDVDDLLDEYMIEALRMGVRVKQLSPHETFAFAQIPNKSRKLKEVLETLDVIVREKSNFNLIERVVDRRPEISGSRQTGSFVIESEIYGRKEDKEKMVELLLLTNTSRSQGSVSTIPVVGIGGIGKTSLAQLSYNDERIKRHFDLRIWVCVSDNFDLLHLIKAIIESTTKNICDFLVMDVLQSYLWDSLRGKRYLLVLDDVWNEDHDEWDKLRTLLSGGAEGSKIVVTTRSKKVASIMGTEFPHHLEGLSEDDCWALFKQRAFHQEEEEDYPNLLTIGKEIVKKCGGVPLASKTLGSLMRFKREEREWLFVRDSELWTLCESENGILPALRLSYNHLPSHLKPCFAFCSIFPKKYEIKKEKLIHLWIAQGLIISSGGSKTMEDIGNEYFNNLLWMSFFQEVKKCDDGNITECKMHDVIHDLARYITGNEFIILESGIATSSISQARHLSVVCNFRTPAILEALHEAKNLRTLLLLFPVVDVGETLFHMSSFRYLRALDLSGCDIKQLHISIGNLPCLRYLDLSNTCIESLPETLCSLLKLQTLKLIDCYNLVELPSNLRLMINLRHVNITGCESLTHMPARIGRLVDLQTLPIFIVGNKHGKGISELQCLNLRGELNIKCLENVSDATEVKMANLGKKHQLHSLGLFWGEGDKSVTVRNAEEAKEMQRLQLSGPSRGRDSDIRLEGNVEALMEGLKPHPNLKRLLVKGYMGVRFPHWMRDLFLPNLIELVLINWKRCEYLPYLGQFPFLRILYLHGMDAVKCFNFYGDGTRGAFPSLKELTLREFPNLNKWLSVDGRELFPFLGKLTINNCPELTTMPLFPSLQHLELRNCNTMILMSVKNLTSLSFLIIDAFPELLHLPERLLQNNSHLISLTISSCPKLHSLSSELGTLNVLKSLTIRWCDELASLPQDLTSLTSLESLEISECPSLLSLPELLQGLVSIRCLSIENCSNLRCLPMALQHLNALELLTIMYCPNLASLPEGLQYLSALRSLNILSCPELASLPEGLKHVTTLQNLEIRSCPGLTALPEWVENLVSLRSLAISDCHNITYLPEGLQHLSVLQHLSILECPNLEGRCKMERGVDWHKIAHIPHIYIGSPGSGQHSSRASSSSR